MVTLKQLRQQRRKDVIARIIAYITKHGWELMDDGSYHNDDSAPIRVTFLQNVVRVDEFTSDRWHMAERWDRRGSVYYCNISFDDEGRPLDIPFVSDIGFK